MLPVGAAPPVVARCPSCGAPLSETSVLALAPVCGHCGVVITSIGGTLGLTSAYGVAEPSITRRRVEADLAVFREYRLKYEGMLEACAQQLQWSADRYAQMPKAPELLDLKVAEHPIHWWPMLLWGMALWAYVWTIVPWGEMASVNWPPLAAWANPGNWLLAPLFGLGCLLTGLFVLLGGFLSSVSRGPIRYWKVQAANGNRPQENARRQRAYEEAQAAAFKAAERRKAAEDHRLRIQIRELEGFARTVGAKEAEVRRVLATL